MRRALLIERGRIIFDGDVAHTVSRMLEQRSPGQAEQADSFSADGPVRMGGLSVSPGADGCIRTGQPVEVRLRYQADMPTDVVFALSIWTEDRWTCIGGAVEPSSRRVEKGEGELCCTLRDFPLLAGRYILRATLLDASTRYPLAVEAANNRECHVEVSTDPDPLTNLLIWTNQLVQLNVEWDTPQGTGREDSADRPGEGENVQNHFDASLLARLACPATGGTLRYDPDKQELICDEAMLAYSIRDGIPVLLIEAARRL